MQLYHKDPYKLGVGELPSPGDDFRCRMEPQGATFFQDPGDSMDNLLDASVAAYDTRHQRPDIEPSELAKQWGIGLDTASKMLKATTQARICNAVTH